jgi:hypothetical protein
MRGTDRHFVEMDDSYRGISRYLMEMETSPHLLDIETTGSGQENILWRWRLMKTGTGHHLMDLQISCRGTFRQLVEIEPVRE